ncbi:MAG: CARDB domain-containing protein, partial [Archaeoglobaceae archaeon]
TDDTNILNITGVEGDPISDGLAFGIYGGDGADNQEYPSGIAPADSYATPIFIYSNIAEANTWNTTLQEGTNILGGNWLGGNAWLKPDGTGYSQTCLDSNNDGICDQPYVIDEENIDYLPLSIGQTLKPDLNITAISITPMQPIANQQATINATISNEGNANAGAFNVSFFVNDELLGELRIQSLGSGSFTFAEIEWTPSLAGSYAIKLVADSDNNVLESDETNNESSITVEVVAPPTPTPTPTTPPTTTPATTPPTTTPRPIIGGGGGGGGGAIPGVPIYISPYIAVMAKERYEITMPSATQKDTNVLSIVVIPEEKVNVRVGVEKIEKLSTEIPKPSGMVALILSVELSLSKETDVKGEINFVLKRDEIRKSGFDPDTVFVSLLRFDEKQRQWIKLDTKLTGKDENYNYYSTATPSFSLFVAILEASEPTPTTNPLVTSTASPIIPKTTLTPASKSTPGFEALFAIAGLITVAYLMRRKI